MTQLHTSRAATFAAVLGLARAAAALGDHWIQTDYCAQVKRATDAAPVRYEDEKTEATTEHGTADGRRACAWHCLTYSSTQALAVTAGARVLGIRLHPAAALAGLAISGLTHYAADRRVPGGLLQAIAERTGKGRFYALASHGLNGAYLLDASYHHACETVAALVATAGAGER
ncbi:hypothetical protein [Streptomyces sp. H27-H5]|uniref:hypothetical protein n=1 Tax=Streptomyces sp. H27-H5 TaxID=2996460 RepID=UPI0022715AFB|nr:hypothetical protein [Streptomyces sp. H27-H5]MCY0961481.1 hypothetical protein [Streptomyces sp. H27-H5]